MNDASNSSQRAAQVSALSQTPELPVAVTHPKSIPAEYRCIHVGALDLRYIEVATGALHSLEPYSDLDSSGTHFAILTSGKVSLNGPEGDSITMKPGTVFALPSGVPLNFTVEECSSWFLLSYPTEEFLARGLILPHEGLIIPYSSQFNLLRVIAHILMSDSHYLSSISGRATAASVFELIAGLLSECLIPHSKRPDYERIRASASQVIHRDHSNPDLNVARLAKICGTARRTLERAFAEIGKTPRQAILEARATPHVLGPKESVGPT